MRIIHPEWRTENLDSNYPFADTATLISRDKVVIAPDTFLDATIYPIGIGARAYISSLEISNRLATIWIGDATNAKLASVLVRSAEAARAGRPDRSYGRPAGLFVADPLQLASAQAWPTGMHTFDIGATEFAASVTIATPEEGVRGLTTAQGGLLAGDAWIVGESGIVVSLDPDDGNIRVDVVGDPLFTRRLCTPLDLFTTPRFVKTINNVRPGRTATSRSLSLRSPPRIPS